MRVRPRPLITLGLPIGYLAIVGITWAVVGLNDDDDFRRSMSRPRGRLRP